MRDKLNEYGISPAVGVILLLGITAALATIAGIVLLDIGDGLTQNAQAGVEVNETTEGVEVTWTTDSNADEIIVQANGQRYRLNSVNDSITLGLNEGSNVSVIGVINGEESVISETTTESDTGNNTVENYNPGSTETLSGTVSINPPIDGATVRVVKNDTVVATTTTDGSGNYSVEAPENSRVEVVVKDFTYDSGSKTFYGSTVRDVGTDLSSPVNVDFTEPESTVTVNGTSLLVQNSTYNGMKTIGSVEQLQAINSDLSSDYMLLNDIDASGTSSWNGGSGFDPIGSYSENTPFTGDFNGNNKTIANLMISGSESGGLFEYSKDTTFKNTLLENFNVSGTYVGTFASYGYNVTIEDVIVKDSEIEGDDYTGGLVGEMFNGKISSVTMDNITVNVTNANGGGIVGYSTAEITDSQANGSIEGGDVIGGLVGATEKKISNSHAKVTVTSTGDEVGGLVGKAEDEITDSYSTGSVTGENEVGGLVGDSSNIIDSYSTSTVEGVEEVGGLVGKADDEITDSYSTGSVTGENEVGGLVGDSSNISNSYATANVEGVEEVGGLVGFTFDDITDSYSTGNVNSTLKRAGGIVGSINSGSISNTYSTGDITGDAEVGGIVGKSKGGNTSNSYVRGNINGSSEVGGLVGYNASTIENSYITGSVTGTQNTGAIVGQNGQNAGEVAASSDPPVDGVVQNIYWNSDTISETTVIGKEGGDSFDGTNGGDSITQGELTGLTTSEMQGSTASSTMSAFDFTNTWTTNSNAYPKLQE